jgi:hypothetical protein
MKDAKGHGSDAHSSGVNKVGQPVSQKVLDTIRSNPNGFSVTLGGEQPKGGYMVSMPGHSMILDANELAGPNGAKIIQDYVSSHADALAEPGAHIGGWTHGETGKTYLDVSHNIPSRAVAVQAGRQRNQIAIFDVKRGKEINTGGDGK